MEGVDEGRDSAPVPAVIVPKEHQMVPEMVASVEVLKERRAQFDEYVKTQLKEEQDFGTVPGAKKRSLFKAGAEKLLSLYGLFPRFQLVEKLEDWDKPFFRYIYRCEVIWPRPNPDNTISDVVVATCDGECNSRESKYAQRWIPEFTLDEATKARAIAEKWPREEKKSKKTGKMYWAVLGSNDDIYTIINTLIKMSQKRALVGAAIIAVKASDLFTQDIEDLNLGGGQKAEKSGGKEKSPEETKKDGLKSWLFGFKRRDSAAMESIGRDLFGAEPPTFGAMTLDQLTEFKAKCEKFEKDNVPA